MEHPHSAAKDTDTRERLSQLEHRVAELEHAAARTQRAQRRSRLVMLLGGVLYVLLIYWYLNQIV